MSYNFITQNQTLPLHAAPKHPGTGSNALSASGYGQSVPSYHQPSSPTPAFGSNPIPGTYGTGGYPAAPDHLIESGYGLQPGGYPLQQQAPSQSGYPAAAPQGSLQGLVQSVIQPIMQMFQMMIQVMMTQNMNHKNDPQQPQFIQEEVIEEFAPKTRRTASSTRKDRQNHRHTA